MMADLDFDNGNRKCFKLKYLERFFFASFARRCLNLCLVNTKMLWYEVRDTLTDVTHALCFYVSQQNTQRGGREMKAKIHAAINRFSFDLSFGKRSPKIFPNKVTDSHRHVARFQLMRIHKT